MKIIGSDMKCINDKICCEHDNYHGKRVSNSSECSFASCVAPAAAEQLWDGDENLTHRFDLLWEYLLSCQKHVYTQHSCSPHKEIVHCT